MDRERTRVGLAIGQRLTEPGRQGADRSDIEIEDTVETLHRPLLNRALVGHRNKLGSNRQIDREAVFAENNRQGVRIESKIDAFAVIDHGRGQTRRRLEPRKLERQSDFRDRGKRRVLGLDSAEAEIEFTGRAFRQAARAGALAAHRERPGGDSDHRHIDRRRHRQLGHRNLVDGDGGVDDDTVVRWGHRQKAGDRPAIETDFIDQYAQGAIYDVEFDVDRPDLVAHRRKAAETNRDIGLGGLQRGQIQRIVGNHREQVFRRDRCRFIGGRLGLGRWLGLARDRRRWGRRQITIDIELVALERENDLGQVTVELEAAGRGRIERVALDHRLGQGHRGSFGSQGRREFERTRIGLSFGQGLAEPCRQVAHRADIEGHRAVEAGHRGLLHRALIARRNEW